MLGKGGGGAAGIDKGDFEDELISPQKRLNKIRIKSD
jgi:hypothetical protein